MPDENLSAISLAWLGLVFCGSCYVYALAITKWPLVPYADRGENDFGGVLHLLKPAGTRSALANPWSQVLGDVRLGIGAFFFGYPPIILAHALLQLAFPYSHDVLDALSREKSWQSLLGLTLGVVVVTPVLEEFLFRNLLQGGLEILERKYIPRATTIAVLISSAAFAAAHFGQGAAHIPLFLFALLLGYLYYRTHRLLPSIVAHATLNGFSVLQFMLL